MDQGVSRRPLAEEARIRFQASQCGICGEQIGTGTGFSPSTSVLPCQYHSTNAPYWSSRWLAGERPGMLHKAILFQLSANETFLHASVMFREIPE